MTQNDIERIEYIVQILDEFRLLGPKIKESELRHHVEKVHRHRRIAEMSEKQGDMQSGYRESSQAHILALSDKTRLDPDWISGLIDLDQSQLEDIANRDTKNEPEDILRRFDITYKNSLGKLPEDVQNRIEELTN